MNLLERIFNKDTAQSEKTVEQSIEEAIGSDVIRMFSENEGIQTSIELITNYYGPNYISNKTISGIYFNTIWAGFNL